MTAILHSNRETDTRMADKLGAAILTTLADTADIMDVPGAVVFRGFVNGEGSDTERVGFLDWDADHAAATGAENTDISTTALADSSITIAVVRHGLRRDADDLVVLTAQMGADTTYGTIAQKMVTADRMGWMDTLAAAIDSFTNIVGSTGVDMSVDDFFDAMTQLELNSVPGPYFCLLHPRQHADLRESLRAEGGAIQYRGDVSDMLRIKGPGYSGNLLGVDIWKSTTIDGDGTDRKGGMWGEGALAWKGGRPVPPPGGTTWVPLLGHSALEFQRNASAATTEAVLHSYYGISVLEDARGVEIRTDQ